MSPRLLFPRAGRRRRSCAACEYTGVEEGICPFCGGEMRAANKYGNRRKVTTDLVPGRSFDSQREANAAAALVLRERAGEVRDIRYQVPFDLAVNGVKVCRYIADFVFKEPGPTVVRAPSYSIDFFDVVPGWRTVVADAKGFRTDVYRIKAKLMKACLGIDIKEI